MAIWGVDGPPGTGKTALAVTLQMREVEKGVRGFANIPLMDLRPRSPLFGWQWCCYMRGIDDLLSIRKGNALLDEADAWFANTEWQKVGYQQKLFWTQHRKEGLNILWTCTHLDRMLNVIRDITEVQYRCMKFPMRWSVARAFDPQQTGTARKSNRWLATRLREDLGELYDTAMRVKHHSEKDTVGVERGANDLYDGYDLRLGTAEEVWVLLQRRDWRGFRVADLGEVQEVAPLLTVQEVEKLARLVQDNYNARPGDCRVASRRLAPVVQRLMGNKWSPDPGVVFPGSRVIRSIPATA